MRHVRGSRISMIFQEPMTSLNPVFTIGSQIMEAITLHQKVGKHEARDRAIEMLRKVKIPEPERRIKDYPHQFSGGMRQRAMIAMALSCTPELLIADEPTTALDVTIQAQILDLLRELQAEVGMSILMITHDLGIVAEMADDVAVMYASKVVEYAPVKELFTNPLYTAGLFNSRPEPGKPKDEKLSTIPGMVPSPLRFPPGCKFHPRCAFCQDVCKEQEPELREQDFIFKPRSVAGPGGSSKTLEGMERAHILRVVEECGGNQSHAAEVLDIDRVTLYHKLKKYGWTRTSLDRDKKPDEVTTR